MPVDKIKSDHIAWCGRPPVSLLITVARLITLPPVTSYVLSVISSACLQIATNDIAH